MLPVRVYCDGENPQGEAVEAIAPDGSTRRFQTGGRGIANITLDQPGVWTIRYRGTSRGSRYLADLVFETLPY